MSDRRSAALAAHCRALAECRRCELAEGIRPVSQLVRAPRVMLVGQAPGQVEADGGRAFAGRAGRTLFRWLETTGVDEETFRRRVYIAAMTRCYPGPSGTGRGDRVPTREERERCGDWLDAELGIIRPRLIIPVGKLAIERFLPPAPLSELIGRVHRVAAIPGDSGMVDVIPLPHPSGASSWIHEPGHRDLVDRALELLRSRFVSLGVASSPTGTERSRSRVA